MRGRLCAYWIVAGSFALFANLASAADSAATRVPLQATPVFQASTSDFARPDTLFGLSSLAAAVRASGTAEPNGPPAPHLNDLRTVAARISLAPELALDLGYRLDDAGQFTRFGSPSGFDGLFLSGSAQGEDYAPFGNATYVGATLDLSSYIALHAGVVSSTQDRNAANENSFSTISRPVDALLDFGARTANTLMAGVTFKASDWGGVDLTASHANEKTGLLDSGPISSLSADMINISAHLKFGNGWVTTASYGESLAKLDIKPSALALSSPGELRQTGYALSIAKHGVFGDDALGLSVSRPLDPEGASGGFATVATPANQPVFIGPDHLLADQKPETDIELGYTTSFNDSFALQTNAAYELNFQGKSGTNAVQLLSRAKIKF